MAYLHSKIITNIMIEIFDGNIIIDEKKQKIVINVYDNTCFSIINIAIRGILNATPWSGDEFDIKNNFDDDKIILKFKKNQEKKMEEFIEILRSLDINI